MITNPVNFSAALAALQKSGRLPASLTQAQVGAIQRSLQRYAGEISSYSMNRLMDQIEQSLLGILNPQQVAREGATATVTEGYNPAEASTAISSLVDKLGASQLAESGFVQRLISVATDVARGAGRYVADNANPDEVDAIPALELIRVYDRAVPRGFKSGPKGSLIEVPEDDWPARWAAAGEACGDEDWLPWDGDAQTGRGVALKSSGIWQALGDGAGGYDDTLGNPFPPFAFNSGFDVNGVDRAEAESLGLLDKGESAEGAELDMAKLFAPIEEAA